MALNLSVRDVVSNRVLIVGERGRGKTFTTAKLLVELLSVYQPWEVTVVDMAPTTLQPSSRLSSHLSEVRGIRYLSPLTVRAPRIEGMTPKGVLELAGFNASAIDPLLDEYLAKPTDALVVNDLTIYLHAGSVKKAAQCALTAETFLANAYRGASLLDRGSSLSEREARALSEFIALTKVRVFEL